MLRTRIIRYGIATIVLIVLGWIALTIYVERTGSARQWAFGTNQGKTALVIFDPDPFYNLDEQVCLAFGEALANDSMHVTVSTVAATSDLPSKQYDVVIFCANTYNWRPDWSITNFIEEHATITKNSLVVAITLGAGSTESSQKYFENRIIDAGGKLLNSYALWLLRPNDETKLEERNVEVALAMAREWAADVSTRIK